MPGLEEQLSPARKSVSPRNASAGDTFHRPFRQPRQERQRDALLFCARNGARCAPDFQVHPGWAPGASCEPDGGLLIHTDDPGPTVEQLFRSFVEPQNGTSSLERRRANVSRRYLVEWFLDFPHPRAYLHDHIHVPDVWAKRL